MFDGAMLYRVVHSVPSSLFLHKSIIFSHNVISQIQQVNFLGILLEWGPDPLRPLPTFFFSVF